MKAKGPRDARRAVLMLVFGAALTLIVGAAPSAVAQQLEPRAYTPSPTGTNFFGIAYVYSHGDVTLDPSLPLDNVTASINGLAPYFGKTFSLFGRLSSVTVVTPYAWGTVKGDLMEVRHSVDRSGFGDPQLRFSMNLIGGPALRPAEFFKRTPQTTLGWSLTVVCPYGQYYPSKLINLGTNRWAVKPELGLSHPAGKWTLELYAGVWVFTDNNQFYGGVVRKQSPLASYQAHVGYNFNPRMWAALDFTYYSGGSTTVNGLEKDDRQANSRGGFTFVVPVSRRQSLKLAWSSGVTARIGQKFRTIAVGWQYIWFDAARKPASS